MADETKRGRPTLLNKQLKEIAITLAGEPGITLAKIASKLNISRTTLYYYLRADSDFLNALNHAMDMADELVEISLFRRAIGYSHPEEKIFQHEGRIIRARTMKHYPPSEDAGKFWLKNRRPDRWADKQEIDLTKDIIVKIGDDEQDL